MSYDFMLMRAKNAAHHKFPCDHDQLEIDDAPFPWVELKSYVRSKGSLVPQANPFDESGPKPFDAHWIIPNIPEIWLHGADDWVSLDGSPDCEVVLNLLIHLRKVDPNVVLADPNEGTYHDVVSFQEMMQPDFEG